jgi:hypothetical protein
LASSTNTPPPAFCGFKPASSSSAVVAAATPARLVELSGTVTDAAPAADAAKMKQREARSAFMTAL